MKKLLTTLVALCFAGVLSAAYAADGAAPAGGDQQKAQKHDKKAKKDKKKEKKQVHKDDGGAK